MSKCIIKTFLTLGSSIHNVVFLSENFVLSESENKYVQIKHSLLTVQSINVIFFILMWEDWLFYCRKR